MALLAELGWQTACGLEETFAPEGGSLGRRDRREVVLQPRLRAALERLNPGQSPEAISAAIEELSCNRSAMGLVSANREVVRLLKDGVLVSVPDLERGGLSKLRLRVIDWDRPAENDWLAVNQFSIKGDLYSCIPDLVGFVNGLPLVVIEFKKPNRGGCRWRCSCAAPASRSVCSTTWRTSLCSATARVGWSRSSPRTIR